MFVSVGTLCRWKGRANLSTHHSGTPTTRKASSSRGILVCVYRRVSQPPPQTFFTTALRFTRTQTYTAYLAGIPDVERKAESNRRLVRPLSSSATQGKARQAATYIANVRAKSVLRGIPQQHTKAPTRKWPADPKSRPSARVQQKARPPTLGGGKSAAGCQCQCRLSGVRKRITRSSVRCRCVTRRNITKRVPSRVCSNAGRDPCRGGLCLSPPSAGSVETRLP